jgi:hypothetical protein
VLIFQESTRLEQLLSGRQMWGTPASFNLTTWTQDGLRFFVVSDASPADLTELSNLLRQVANPAQ